MKDYEEMSEFRRRRQFGKTGFTRPKNQELYGGRRGIRHLSGNSGERAYSRKNFPQRDRSMALRRYRSPAGIVL